MHDWDRAAACGHDGLRALAARCNTEMEWLAKSAGTWLSHVRDQAGDPLLAQDWDSFGARLSRDRQEVLRLRAVLTAHRVVIPDVPDPSFIEGLRQAQDRLGQSSRLGMFAGPPSGPCRPARLTAGRPAPPRTSTCASGRSRCSPCASGC